MSVSSEFARAVSDQKALSVRIMLKDSLLVDKSFSLFDEMQKYAVDHGASPWMEPEDSLEKEEAPWSEDTLNYELTALVNDFTHEHVDYIKNIISSIFGSPSSFQRPVNDTENVVISDTAPSRVINGKDPYKIIVDCTHDICRVLKRNKG